MRTFNVYLRTPSSRLPLALVDTSLSLPSSDFARALYYELAQHENYTLTMQRAMFQRALAQLKLSFESSLEAVTPKTTQR